MLVDDKGKALARLQTTRLAGWKDKTVEVIGGEEGERVKEEALVTALAIAELRRRRSRNSGGGAGGGAP